MSYQLIVVMMESYQSTNDRGESYNQNFPVDSSEEMVYWFLTLKGLRCRSVRDLGWLEGRRSDVTFSILIKPLSVYTNSLQFLRLSYLPRYVSRVLGLWTSSYVHNVWSSSKSPGPLRLPLTLSPPPSVPLPIKGPDKPGKEPTMT